MKLTYDPETDSLYIEFKPVPSADSDEIADGVVVDYDTEGKVVGLDIERASEKLELDRIETVSLPRNA